LQIFQPQFQLLDLPLQLLRLAPELHSPQLAQQQLQMFNLALARNQPLLGSDPFSCSATSSTCNVSRSSLLRSGSVLANMRAVCHERGS